MNWEIRLLRPEDSIEELTTLLHRAYKELADMGFRYVATYQTPEVTAERIAGAECYVAVAPDVMSNGEGGARSGERVMGNAGGDGGLASGSDQTDSQLAPPDSTFHTPHSTSISEPRPHRLTPLQPHPITPSTPYPRLVGAICFHDASFTGGCPWYGRPEVASFHQFAVDPGFQRQGIGSALLDMAEQRARETGAKEIALDTAEGAAHLIALYERRGYRFIEYAQWSVTNYRSVIMSKKLGG